MDPIIAGVLLTATTGAVSWAVKVDRQLQRHEEVIRKLDQVLDKILDLHLVHPPKA